MNNSFEVFLVNEVSQSDRYLLAGTNRYLGLKFKETILLMRELIH